MGMRFRKSIKLGPGVRFNLSKTGVGLSAGAGGLRYSVHSSGRVTKTARLPGTGVYYMKQTGGHSGGRSAAARREVRQVSPAQIASAGLFAPKYEKTFAQAAKCYVAIGGRPPQRDGFLARRLVSMSR